ncbi:hypothetical protein [Flavobacterium sp. 102]|uniref:hypothetical protein n=1 Tax=Flavobacterium sp. 102 TaxID=2135623 RepID=UPI000EB204AD|nr:hypothetical protein [Flavobacterium sp. 102]RKS00416.1 hypothetical protein C8C84_0024 [Flavobacterium sp. 102]
MARHTYKGIVFAEGWNGTFEQFKLEFEETHVFKGLQPKERLAEMKKVFNTITKTEPAKDQKQ